MGNSLRREQELSRRWGGLVLLRIEKSEPYAISALVKEGNNDQALLIEFSVKESNPNLVRDFTLQGAETPPEFMPPRIELVQLERELQKKADEEEASGAFSGQILIARHGEELFSQNWGYANRLTGQLVTDDTRFRIASIGKMFTAIAILQLVDAGKLSLDKTVGDYLPDYPNREIASEVTLRELLNHTGGTGNIFGKEFELHRNNLREHADYIKLFGKRKPEFIPGSKDSYSNYGFILLGAIIEKVSGKSYYDYVQDMIFSPAGMTHTGMLPETQIASQLSVGYTKGEHGKEPNTSSLPYRATAAGGCYTTAHDLLKFSSALENERLVSHQLLDQATQPQNHGRWYGYGFVVSGEGDLRQYGHEGGAPGMDGKIMIYPKLGYVVIGLANVDPQAVEWLVSYFANRMPL